MKVKIPSRIKIGTHTYSVLYNPHLWHDEKLYGSANYRKQTIEIDSNTPYTEKVLTLLHEVVHIIGRNAKCNLDEADVDRLSNGLADVLLNELDIEFDWSNISEHQH